MPVRKSAQNSFLKIQLVENRTSRYVACYEPYEDGTGWCRIAHYSCKFYDEAVNLYYKVLREYEAKGQRFPLTRG